MGVDPSELTIYDLEKWTWILRILNKGKIHFSGSLFLFFRQKKTLSQSFGRPVQISILETFDLHGQAETFVRTPGRGWRAQKCQPSGLKTFARARTRSKTRAWAPTILRRFQARRKFYDVVPFCSDFSMINCWWTLLYWHRSIITHWKNVQLNFFVASYMCLYSVSFDNPSWLHALILWRILSICHF